MHIVLAFLVTILIELICPVAGGGDEKRTCRAATLFYSGNLRSNANITGCG
jgi:hypothetical protein